MTPLLRVGLTGGMGSGKSTVAHLLQMLGAAVYVADDRAKGLMVTDPDLRRTIVRDFGTDAYLPDGTLNRSFLSQAVFGHPTRLARLNAAVHPAVGRDFAAWVSTLESADEGERPAYAVEEAAILIESGAWRAMNRIVTVTAPLSVRLRRIMQRDGLPREAALRRIEAQLDEATRERYAQFTIRADDQQLVIPQVLALHTALCHEAEGI